MGGDFYVWFTGAFEIKFDFRPTQVYLLQRMNTVEPVTVKHGGKRPGAGRPKGTKRAPASTTIRVAVAVVEECKRIDSAYRATAPAQFLPSGSGGASENGLMHMQCSLKPTQ